MNMSATSDESIAQKKDGSFVMKSYFECWGSKNVSVVEFDGVLTDESNLPSIYNPGDIKFLENKLVNVDGLREALMLG